MPPVSELNEEPLLISNHGPRTLSFRVRVLSLALAGVVIAIGLATALGCGGGGGGSDSDAVAALEKFLLVGQAPGATSKVMLDELPPGLPSGLPMYSGATLIGSMVVTGGGSDGIGVLWGSSDPLDKVYAFYDKGFNTSPWLIRTSRVVGKSAGVEFENDSDSSVSGSMTIQPSNNGDGSMMFLFMPSLSATATPEGVPAVSEQLPANWPPIDVYPGAVVSDSAWAQTTTTIQWQITILAKAAPSDVIEFYRGKLSKLGLLVEDKTSTSGAPVLSFTGTQGTETWKGAVSAEVFAQDPTYAQVVIQTAFSTSATPQPLGTPSP
jgi:hypothetical protein